MDILLKEALYYYEIEYPQVEFIRHNENKIYKVTDTLKNQSYVVRIHKPSKDFYLDIFEGNRNFTELIISEMDIINSINENLNIKVQVPIRNKDSKLVTKLRDGTLVTVLSWIKGNTADKVELTDEILFKIGMMLGKFHRFSKAYSREKNLKRYSYDRIFLQKIYLSIKKGIDAKIISSEQYKLMGEAIKKIGDFINELDLDGDSKGFIHSDLAKSNLIVSENREIALIDFGLSGSGHYYMDLGSIFNHFKEPNQQKYIINGYRCIIKEPIKAKYIEAFMAFQCVLFISTHIQNAHKYSWFNKAVEKWCIELFGPLVNEKQFISKIVNI